MHGLSKRTKRSVKVENDKDLSRNDDEPRSFRSKKVRQIQLARDTKKTQEKLSRAKRAATALKSRLWPDRIIPYKIDDVFDSKFGVSCE